MEIKLTEKQREFCRQYLIDLNATQAAIRAGYSQKTAKDIASQNLAKLNIQSYIDFLVDERSKRTEITQDNVLKELAKMGFANIQNLYDEDGDLIPIHKLKSDVAASIQEVNQDSIRDDNGNEVIVKRKYKLSDKKANLELIGRHLKLFTDKHEHTGQVVINISEKESKIL